MLLLADELVNRREFPLRFRQVFKLLVPEVFDPLIVLFLARLLSRPLQFHLKHEVRVLTHCDAMTALTRKSLSNLKVMSGQKSVHGLRAA